MGQIRVKPHIRQGRPVKGHVRKQDARPRFREGATFHWRDYTDTAGDVVRVFVQIDEYDGDKAHLRLVYQGSKGRQTGRRYTMPRASVPLHVNDLQGNVSDVTAPSGDKAIDAVIRGEAELAGKGNDGVVYLVGDEAVKVGTTTPFHPESQGHRTPAGAIEHSRREAKAHEALKGLDLVPPARWREHGGRGWLVKPRMEVVADEDLTLDELKSVSDAVAKIHATGMVLGDSIQLARGTQDGKLYLMDLGQVQPLDANKHHNDRMSLQRLWHDAGHKYGLAEVDAADKALAMVSMVETALAMDAPEIVARWGTQYLDVVDAAQSYLYDEGRDDEAWKLELLARRVRDALNAQRDEILQKAVDVGPPPEENRDEYPYVGTINWPGLPTILVETAAGTYREGKGWRVMLDHHYGEFEGTLGTDGDPVDVFVGPYPPGDDDRAYVIHQKRPGTREFDEDKVMIGFRTREHAIRAYRKQYDRPGYFAGVSTWRIPELTRAMTGTWKGKALWRRTTLRADLKKGEQLALFGQQQVSVRPHIRRTKSGKAVPVKQHRAQRAKAAPKGPGPRPERREDLWRWDPFRRWFGDSKVVDAKGDPQEQHGPLVVYHGTPVGGFEAFDPKKDKGQNLFGHGFYFTADREIAESYTEKDAETSWMSARRWLDADGGEVQWMDQAEARKVLDGHGFTVRGEWDGTIPYDPSKGLTASLRDAGSAISAHGNTSPKMAAALARARSEDGRFHVPTFWRLCWQPHPDDVAADQARVAGQKYQRPELSDNGMSDAYILKGFLKVMEDRGAVPDVPKAEIKEVYLAIKNPADMDAPVSDEMIEALSRHKLQEDRTAAAAAVAMAEEYLAEEREGLEQAKDPDHWRHQYIESLPERVEAAKRTLQHSQRRLRKVTQDTVGTMYLDYEVAEALAAVDVTFNEDTRAVPITRKVLEACKAAMTPTTKPDDQFMHAGKPLWYSRDKGLINQDVWTIMDDKRFMERVIRAMGHDGIRHTGGWNIGAQEHTVWIAFEPTQIKATTSEAFDSSTPNMYKGLRLRVPDVPTRQDIRVTVRDELERWGRWGVQASLATMGGEQTARRLFDRAATRGGLLDALEPDGREVVLRTVRATMAAFAAGQDLAKALEQLTLPLVTVKAHVRRGQKGPIMVQRHIRRNDQRRAAPAPRPRQLVLYAGMGGDALGGMQAGTQVVGMIENDPHAVATLRAAKSAGHLQGDVIDADLNSYDFKPWRGKVDILTGGPPCQPFSRAGKQAGPEDLRDGWPTVLRAVKEVGPRAVAMENVRGLLDAKYRGYRRVITDELARLGYQSQWRTLDAAHFGVPQARQRVWLVAWKDGTEPWTGPDTSLGEPRSASAAWRAHGFATQSTAEHKDPVPSARGAAWLQKHPPSDVGSTLGAPDSDDPAFTQIARYGAGSVNLAWVPVVEPGARVLIDDSADKGLSRVTGRTLEEILEDPDASFIKDAEEWGAVMDGNGVTWGRGLLLGQVVEDNGDTLTVEVRGHGTEVWPRSYVYGTDKTVKRLPPEAMAALQDFPVDYPIQGGDNARGRQAGNAIPPRLAQAVLAPFVQGLAPMSKGEQMSLFGPPIHVKPHQRQGRPVKAHLRTRYAGKGAPSPGERGYREPPPERGGDNARVAAQNIIASARNLYDDPDLAMMMQVSRGEDDEAVGVVEDVPDLLLVPRVIEGRHLTDAERVDIARDALALAAETLPGRGVFDDHMADPIMKGRGDRRHQLGWRMPRDQDEWTVAEAIAAAVFHDRLYAFATGDRGKLRLEPVSLTEARQFVSQHHSALPAYEDRGAMYAVGLKRGRRLAAVAIAGTPSGRWEDPHSVLELYRVASDGTTAFAASKLTARMIDLVESSAREGAVNAPRLVTYSLKGEPGDVYKALRNKGMRPVAIVRGKRGAQGARGNVEGALGHVDKIRWEAGPGAGEARWDILLSPVDAAKGDRHAVLMAVARLRMIAPSSSADRWLAGVAKALQGLEPARVGQYTEAAKLMCSQAYTSQRAAALGGRSGKDSGAVAASALQLWEALKDRPGRAPMEVPE